MPDNEKTSDMKKAAIYIRVARKDDEAVRQQEKMLQAYSEQRGYRNALTYVDNGVSGLGLDRPALNRLQRDIADGLISAVMVSNISRVGRRYIEVNNWINNIRREGVSFTSVQDGITDEKNESQEAWFPRYHDYLALTNQPPN